MSANAERFVVAGIAGEFRRYKTLAEGAVAQLTDDDLHVRLHGGNSVATLLQHLGGNLKSRFTDFLTSDGEKPWRDREGEFEERTATRVDLLRTFEEGWRQLATTLDSLKDEQLETNVTIRGVSLSVMEALTRSLAHVSYHVGQVVLIARSLKGAEWRYLSIPPGGTASYNKEPQLEKPPQS